MILSRRYAAACTRAARMARLMRWLHNVQRNLSAVALAAMPARYAFAGVAVSAAGRVSVFSESLDTYRQRLRYQAGDLLARRPGLALRGARMRTAGLCAFAAAAILFFTVALYGTGLEVIMDGQSMGYVTRQSEVTASIENVGARISQIIGTPYVMQPDVHYQISVVRRSKIFNQVEFEQELFESVGAVRQLYVLSVDGLAVGAMQTRAAVVDVLDDILEQNPVYGDFDTAAFVQDVKIDFRYVDAKMETDSDGLMTELTEEVRSAVYDVYSKSEGLDSFCDRNGITEERLGMLNPTLDLKKLEDQQSLLIKGALPFLSVAHGRRFTYEAEVPYEVSYKDNTSLYKGEERVKVKGVPGTAVITAEQMFQDGQIVGVNEIGQEIVQEPVMQIVEKGTKVKYALGTFIKPLKSYRITSPYGNRSGGFHQGIDLAAPKNTKIFASDGGKVIFSGWSGTYGQLVIIQHNSTYMTYYAHCNKLLVKEGQMVAQGDNIALVGTTGRSTGNHLHFEIHVNKSTINPKKMVKF